MFLFFLNKYIGVELLGLTLSVDLNLQGTARLFPKVVVPFYVFISNVRVSVALSPHQILMLVVFLILAILVDEWVCLIGVLICVSQTDKKLFHRWLFGCSFLLSVHIFCQFVKVLLS